MASFESSELTSSAGCSYKGGNKGAVRVQEKKIKDVSRYFEFISLVAFHITFGFGDQLTNACKSIADSASSA